MLIREKPWFTPRSETVINYYKHVMTPLLGVILILLHHLPPRRKNHLIAAFLEETLALILVLRP